LGRYKTGNLLALLEAGLASVTPRVLLERLKGVARVDVSTEAQSVAVPTLYLRATSDRLVPASAGAHIAQCMPLITLRDLEGPHFLLQARADAASEEILSFASACVA
jgi:pimeloyl-ACP methyl ester carboxylesterase